MRTVRLESMTRGWFVGDFEPVAFKTGAAEVAVKSYSAGQTEARHVHRIATELTAVISGTVAMNGETFGAGEIIVLDPGDVTDFRAVTDTVTVVVKIPAVPGDKYVVDNGTGGV
jgi:anti-sigma factor ChrR (cupin superfamily)